MCHTQKNVCSPAKDIKTLTLTDSYARGVDKERKKPDQNNAKTSMKAPCLLISYDKMSSELQL